MADLALDEDSRAVIERLVAEKQRLLAQAAPQILLQSYLDDEAGAAEVVLRQLGGSPIRPAGESFLAAAFDAEAVGSSGYASHKPARRASSSAAATPRARSKPASPRPTPSGRLGERTLQRAEREAAEARAREAQECTFRPTIHPYVPPPPPPLNPARPQPGVGARQAEQDRVLRERVQQARQGGFDGEGFFERNVRWHEERERERAAKQVLAEAAELAECTFRPDKPARAPLARSASASRIRVQTSLTRTHALLSRKQALL